MPLSKYTFFPMPMLNCVSLLSLVLGIDGASLKGFFYKQLIGLSDILRSTVVSTI